MPAECAAGGHGALGDIKRMVLCLLDGKPHGRMGSFQGRHRVVSQKCEVERLWL